MVRVLDPFLYQDLPCVVRLFRHQCSTQQTSKEQKKGCGTEGLADLMSGLAVQRRTYDTADVVGFEDTRVGHIVGNGRWYERDEAKGGP